MQQADIPIAIGRNIRHQRHLAGLSLKALGAHLGITYQQMQKYETGANDISCEKMLRLAALFQCSIDTLCEGIQETEASLTPAAMRPDAYRISLLVSHFQRIPSQAVKNKLCRLVQTLADTGASAPQEGI